MSVDGHPGDERRLANGAEEAGEGHAVAGAPAEPPAAAAATDGAPAQLHANGAALPAALKRDGKMAASGSGRLDPHSPGKRRGRSSSPGGSHDRAHSGSSGSRERRRRRGERSCSRERHSRRSRSRSAEQRSRHGKHKDSKHRRHHHRHHHHHEPRKRSRSRSAPWERAEAAAPREAAAAPPPFEAQPGGPFAAAAGAPPPPEAPPAAPGDVDELIRRDSSVGASSLVKLSLRPALQPSPSAAAAAAMLAPPPPGAARAASAEPSPAGPPGLARLHTPSGAALAASHGFDPSDVAVVQPSPMAAEATVAALSALMAQPARASSLPAPRRAHVGGAGGHDRHDKHKPLLSFGDELEEDDGEASGGGSGMSAATAKRFKHEKTLVMLNPSLSADLHAHCLGLLDEEVSLPCSPAAPLDRRLGQLVWGSAQAKGLRPYMEDRHTVIGAFHPRASTGRPVQDGVFRAYAAVFDGHNGAGAADHAADRLHHVLAAEAAIRTCSGEGPPAAVAQEEERVAAALVHSFEAVDKEIMTRCRLESTKGGATGLVVLRIGNQLYAAHCGDTRAVLCRGGEALRLTEDHKPNLPRERKRVEGLGGRVDFARCWRVIVDPGDGRPASGLAVSRAFGDRDFKEPLHLVTATPDVMRERLLPGDDFVILASDGLWDVLTDSEACGVVRRHLLQAGAPRQITPPQLLPGAAAFGAGAFADQMRRPPALTAALATAAAERLVQESLDRGTMDNVTAVVGLLQWD